MLQPLILLIVLILLNAVFASAEIAVLSCNASKLKKMASEGSKKAERLLKLTEQPARFLATIQVAITLAGLLQSAFAAENFAGPLVVLLTSLGIKISEEILRTAAIFVITIILSYFTLVFGELVPKRIAMKKSETLALGLANMLYFVSKVFAPIVWILTASTNGIIRLFGINPNESSEAVTEEEIRMMLDEGNEQGTIQEEENLIIQNVFELNDTSVEEICTHRRDIVFLNLNDSDDEWAEIIKNNRYTFYPVCKEAPDNIVGVLDTRDYFRTEDKSKENLMKVAVSQPFCVPEVMTANVLFNKMKENRSYFAVIIDEYGSLSGVITLHDLLETLVGDINEEESEDSGKLIEKVSDNHWVIHGSASLDEVSESLGINLNGEDYDTFNGYVCIQLGRVPRDGESFEFETENIKINVHNVKNNMIEYATVSAKTE